MKKNSLLLVILALSFYSHGQIQKGFYAPPVQKEPCISEVQYKDLNKKIKLNRERLIREGKLQPGNSKSIQTVSLQWPLEANNGLNDSGYHSISKFVDHDSLYPNQLLDYNCGNRTYDINDGYNHQGTDIALWPFGWYKMEHDQVKIVAAAAGTIVYKDDGHPDQSCDGFSVTTPFNGIVVQHTDGSTAHYVHMKSGSLSVKTVGQAVVAGEYLGIVGSSGISTGPHLHFEVHDANDNVIDPFYGTCNSMNSSSWWISQNPYINSGINTLLTLSAPSIFPICPGIETSNEQTHFCSGQQIYFAVYYRDLDPGQITQYEIIKPDNTTWFQYNDTATSFYSAAYFYYNFGTLPNNALSGTWKYRVIYNGQTYERLFYVNVAPSISFTGLTLMADIPNATYQWLDCNNSNMPIAGQTDQSFIPSQNGNYAVTVSQSTCPTDTASCFFIGSVNIEDNKHLTSLSVYPNPSTGKFILDLKNLKLSFESTTISIYSVLGKRIYNSEVLYNNSTNSESIDISEHPSGSYFMRIRSASSVETIKIIKH